MPTTIEITTCIFPTCGKTLGQESRDMDYRVCKEHRICSICQSEATPLQPHEVRACHDKYLEDLEKDPSSASMELSHPRCSIHSLKHSLTNDPTLSVKQSHYDFLNNLRLMVVPDPALALMTNQGNAMIQSDRFVHNMTFDQKYAHLKMLEACVASVNLALGQDKATLKRAADAREEKEAKKALAQAKTSTRPAAKVDKPEDATEMSIATFMENFGIRSRKIALALQKDRDKAVASFVKLGVPATAAKASIDNELKKKISEGKQAVDD